MPIKKSQAILTALPGFTDLNSEPAQFTLGLDRSADLKSYQDHLAFLNRRLIIVVIGCLKLSRLLKTWNCQSPSVLTGDIATAKRQRFFSRFASSTRLDMRINWRLLWDNRDSGNREMLLVESGILGFGNHNSVQRIRNPVTTGSRRGI